MSDLYTKLDGNRVWPNAGERLDKLEWALRYGEPTKEDLLCCASILSCYRRLLTCTKGEREEAVKKLRDSRMEVCPYCGMLESDHYE